MIDRLADALERYLDDRETWANLGGARGLVMQAWRSPSSSEDAPTWRFAYQAAIAAEEPLLRYAATLGVPIDGARLHRNLCGLLALRCDDVDAAAVHVGGMQAWHWRAEHLDAMRAKREVVVPAAVRVHADGGELIDLHLARFESDSEGLSEHSDLALVPVGCALLDTVRACAPRGGSFVWSLRPRRPFSGDVPFDGTSCGGALRVGFRVLNTQLAYDPSCLILTDRDFGPVQGESAKIAAALRDGGIRRVLVSLATTSDDRTREVSVRLTLEPVATEDQAFALAICQLDASGQPCEPGDPFYVEPAVLRDARDMLNAVDSPRLLTVRGPKASGKTSLAYRLQAEAHEQGRRFVLVNLDDLQRLAFTSTDLFFREFAALLVEGLGGPPLVDADWESRSTNAKKCRSLVERHLDPAQPVTIVIDQADSILESPVKGDFYRMLRVWHNEGSLPTALGRKWKSCRMLLLVSANPNRFITENASPFNSGVSATLAPLAAGEVRSLLDKAGLSADWADAVHLLTGGWPYLVRRALLALTRTGGHEALAVLERDALTDAGPFTTWLDVLWTQVHRRSPDMELYLRNLIEGRAFQDGEPVSLELTRYRLIRWGVLRDEPQDVYSCDLFRRYFSCRFQVPFSVSMGAQS